MPVFASGLPIGPVGTMSHSQAVAFLVVSMACTVVVVGYAVYEVVRRRSALLIYCLIGSVFCNFTEPFWDVLGGLRFKEGNIWAYTMFPDQPVPIHYAWWAIFVYSFFAGVGSYIFVRVFDANVKRTTFWCFIAGQALWNFVLEGFVDTRFAYHYHGNQPWRFLTDFPLWWVFSNYGVVLAGALIVVAIRRWGKRARAVAILVVPSSFAAWEMWAGWPVFAALNSDLGSVGRNIAALVTACISLGTLWAMRELMQPASRTGVTEQRPYEVNPASAR